MFRKLVAVDPVNLVPEAEKKLYDYAEEVILYQDIPSDDGEIIRRIGDADAVLVCYTTTISRHVLEHCPNVVYVACAAASTRRRAPTWILPTPGPEASRCWESAITATAAWWSMRSMS